MTVAGGPIGSVLAAPAGHRRAAGARATRRSFLPVSVVALSAATGVLVVAAADTTGRLGYPGAPWADRLYWLGQSLIVLPAATRLLSRRLLDAAGTITLVVVLTVAEYLAKVCYSPAAFTFSDELAHWRSAVNILQTGKLSTANYLLPISPHYPGLEEVATALVAATGLSVFAAGLIVAGAAHLLFACVLYVLFRNVSGSHRIAGIAVLLYSSNPLFPSFGSMFIYQTLAMPFFGLTLLAAFRLAAPEAARHRGGWLTVAATAIGVTVITHHVTSYMLVVVLAVLAVGSLTAGNRPAAAWTSLLALFSAAAVVGWLVFAAPATLGYLQPVADTALRSFWAVLTGGHSSAPPTSAGPLGNRLLGAAAVLAMSALLPAGWWQVWRRYRREPWLVAMAIGSASWYAVIIVRIAVSDGSELAGRAATFVYVPASIIAALAIAALVDMHRPWRAAAGGAALAGALLLMFDALANGWPPYWERLPGPYQVAGAERSVGPEETAAAGWALTALGPGNRFGADAGSYSVLGSYGDQDVVRNVAYLYTASAFTE